MAEIRSLIMRLGTEIKKNGIANTYYKVKEKRAKDLELKDYEKERLAQLPTAEALELQRNHEFPNDVAFSIVVPTYHTPELFLRQMTESVLGQTFCRVELCIADGSSDDSVEKIIGEYAAKDPRVKYQRLCENKGISENTNAGLSMAAGDYIGLLDHDDLLEPDALYEVRTAMEEHPEAEVFYTDEDKVSFDLSHYFCPHKKQDFNRDLLRSNNYICHFLVMKREILERVGAFRPEFDGAQDYDLTLRLTEQAKEVVHIPKVLYHWRSHEASTAANPLSKRYAYEAGKRAVEAHLERMGEKGRVTDTRFFGFYQTDYEIKKELSVNIISCCNRVEKHKKILNIFSNELHRQNAGNVIYYENGFNNFVIFSKKIQHPSQILLFVDGSLEHFQIQGLQQLAANCMRPGIGMAGGRILSEKKKLLHGRMDYDENGRLTDADAGLPRGFTGHFHSSILQQDTEGVSYQFFAVRTSLFEAWVPSGEGLSEQLMQQLCTFVKESGYRITYVPSAAAYRKKER